MHNIIMHIICIIIMFSLLLLEQHARAILWFTQLLFKLI